MTRTFLRLHYTSLALSLVGAALVTMPACGSSSGDTTTTTDRGAGPRVGAGGEGSDPGGGDASATTTPDAAPALGASTPDAAPSREGASDGGAEPRDAASVPAGDACTTCMASKCPSYAACERDPACVALNDCVSACENDACTERCAEAHATGVEPFRALLACGASLCAAPCGVTPPPPPPPLVSVGDACSSASTCATNFCADEAFWCTRSCAADADCAGYGEEGSNGYGRPNYCAPNNGEAFKVCFPSCTRQADCDVYGSSAGRPKCLRHANGRAFCDNGTEGVPLP